MEIKMRSLTLRNFKGIQDFLFNPDSAGAAVLGANATGKTTLFDAFCWLLFGKDSLGRTDFEIKRLDETGEAAHNLEHTVIGEFLVDGDLLALRRTLQEKWTKKRGSASSEFTGHTVDHYVDGVPVRESEYRQAVAKMAGDELRFRLATNPRHFNEGLKWNERRRLLLEICGDIGFGDVIDADPELARLPQILGKRSIDDHRKILLARRQEINRDLTEIPARIDEARRSTVEIGESQEVTERQLQETREVMAEYDAEVLRIRNGGEVATARLRKLESELLERANRAEKEKNQALSSLTSEMRFLTIKMDDLQRRVRQTGEHIIEAERAVNRHNGEIQKLRDRWVELDARKHDQPGACPTCGQPLPPEAVEAAVEAFNLDKSAQLEAVSLEGKDLKNKIQGAEHEIARWRQEQEQTLIQIEGLREQTKSLSGKMSAMESPVEPGAEVKELQDNMADLASSIETIREEAERSAADCLESKELLRPELMRLEDALATIRANARAALRIQELERTEKALAAEFERLEGELRLTELFLRTKVALLESRINGCFKLATFRLFENQINGGLNECCEVMVGGVPYGSLNNAARINVGLDICNAVARHYGIVAPVWVDNAEAVNDLFGTMGQQIRLVVSRDENMKMEVLS